MPFSGLRLSTPLPIFGLVVRYTTNYLIGRRLILRPCVSGTGHSSTRSLPSIILTFARLSRALEQIIDALLSRLLPLGKLAWLSRIQIAALVRRINGNWFGCICIAVISIILTGIFGSVRYFLPKGIIGLHFSQVILCFACCLCILPASCMTLHCQAFIPAIPGRHIKPTWEYDNL